MPGLIEFKEYVKRNPLYLDEDDFDTYDELFEAAFEIDNKGTREFLWEMLQINDKWRDVAIDYLADGRFVQKLTSEEYELFGKFVDSEM